jgi:hypothetical protein
VSKKQPYSSRNSRSFSAALFDTLKDNCSISFECYILHYQINQSLGQTNLTHFSETNAE